MEKVFSVLTANGGKYELSKSLMEKMVVLSDGTILINENYKFDDEILNKKAFFNNIIIDGQYFTNKDKIKYVSAEVIREYYEDNLRVTLLQDTNLIQKRILDIITVAFLDKITDIHIVLQYPSTFILFRELGELKLYQELTYDDGNAICTTLYNSMTLSSGTSYYPREAQDANMRPELLPEGLSGVRISTGPTQGGNNFMVLRLLPIGHNSQITSLGYSKSQFKALLYCNSANNGGITIICGPTGSGKSTTLQALAKMKLMETKGTINFLTIEDPVEYPITVDDYVMVEQKDQDSGNITMKKTKVTYSARQITIASSDSHEFKKEAYRKAIVSAMRQDPDIIMIGEIRDEATARAAITASNTGHPVLTTVHARNAQMIIDRLLTIGADKNLLLSPQMINGLIAQHLVPELCPNCKKLLKMHIDLVDSELVARLKNVFAQYDGLDNIYIRNNSNGCGYYDKNLDRICVNGYIGRSVIAEVILPDEEYLQYMRDGKILDAYNYWINGMKGYTMMTHGLAKVKHGFIDPESLERKLKQISIQENLKIALNDLY